LKRLKPEGRSGAPIPYKERKAAGAAEVKKKGSGGGEKEPVRLFFMEKKKRKKKKRGKRVRPGEKPQKGFSEKKEREGGPFYN